MTGGGGCPLVNKFEQVSSDDHQMLLAGGVGAVGPMSDVLEGGGGHGWGRGPVQ